MIVIPSKLVPYIDFDDGKIISTDLPDSLEKEFEEFVAVYNDLKNNPKYRLADF